MKRIIFILATSMVMFANGQSFSELLVSFVQTPIFTAADLAAINNKTAFLQNDYVLMNDLILEDWTPIGTGRNPFYGVFDGNGYTITIKSFHISKADTASDENGAFSIVNIGLFGTTGNGAIIKNLTVAGNLTYNSGDVTLYMGAIVGNNGGLIRNCASTAHLNAIGGLYSAKRGWGQLGFSALMSAGGNTTAFFTYQNEACGGGITGMNRGMIVNCYAAGNITVSGKGHKSAGGIAGRNGFGNGNGGSIICCYTTGNITAKEDAASRIAGGITSICTPGDVLHCVALNPKIESIGNRNGMTVGGFGVAYPANIAFGVIASVIEPASFEGVVYNPEAIRNCAYFSDGAHSRVTHAYYRSDMTIYEAKDEEDEKANKKVKKNVFEGNRGKTINYEQTLLQSWWEDKKAGVVFYFGTDEAYPWVWDNNLKRPVLYWQTEEGKALKRSEVVLDSAKYAKNKELHKPKSPDDSSYFMFCNLQIRDNDLSGKRSWNEAQKSCPAGWRLPAVNELQWMCRNKSRIEKFYEEEYWSGEKDNKGRCLSVTTNDCGKEKRSDDEKYAVRCVKEQPIDWKNPDFICHYKVTEYSKEEKAYKVEIYDDVVVTDFPQTLTWQEALKNCPTGWRLPTEKELKKMCEDKLIPMFNGGEYWSDKEGVSFTTNDCKKEKRSNADKCYVRYVRSK